LGFTGHRITAGLYHKQTMKGCLKLLRPNIPSF
jgi:hypothetical protein